jgi:hypothetical protein
MGTRHPNPRLVKTHRSYDIREIARLFQLHPNTVRAWQKQGLKPIDDRRPVVFHGAVFVAFLRARRAKAKRPCPPGYIYCLPCHALKQPAGDMADYIPITATTGNLRGICPTCGRLIHRRVKRAKLAAIQGKLEVTFTDAESRIRGTGNPSVNCDFNSKGAR